MNLIDSHIHLDFNAFDADRDSLLKTAQAAGIQRFIVPSTTRESWPLVEKLTSDRSYISAAYGIHPYFSHAHTLDDCFALERWIQHHPGICIGEIGLDFYLKVLDRGHQMKLFQAQLDIARNNTLPVILHARKAVDEVIIQLKNNKVNRGIVHSFNGSYIQAMRLIDMGLKLGFGGAITYPRATRLKTLIKRLPLDSICLETDAPDQPSSHFKGGRNEPIALIEVLNTVAHIHNTDLETIAEQTRVNTCTALGLI